jgi:hypothetical protein
VACQVFFDVGTRGSRATRELPVEAVAARTEETISRLTPVLQSRVAGDMAPRLLPASGQVRRSGMAPMGARQ